MYTLREQQVLAFAGTTGTCRANRAKLRISTQKGKSPEGLRCTREAARAPRDCVARGNRQESQEIARTAKVLYLDCELSDKQFQLHYCDKTTGARHIFPENILRAEIRPTQGPCPPSGQPRFPPDYRVSVTCEFLPCSYADGRNGPCTDSSPSTGFEPCPTG